jgi:hypothetical protein
MLLHRLSLQRPRGARICEEITPLISNVSTISGIRSFDAPDGRNDHQTCQALRKAGWNAIKTHFGIHRIDVNKYGKTSWNHFCNRMHC